MRAMNRRKSSAGLSEPSQWQALSQGEPADSGHLSCSEVEEVARRLMAAGEYEAALPYLQQATALNPASAPAWCLLGQVYFARMMWPQAEERFRKALALDFGLLEAHFNLGVLYQQQRRFYEALAFFKQVVMNDPHDWECFVRMGQCTAELGNLTDAEAFYAEALRLKPDSVEAAGGLARVFLATEQLDKAVASLELALRSHPDCIELRAALAYVYEQDGEYDKALAQFYQLVKDRPQEAQFYYHLGHCCVELGLLREAEPLFAKASLLEPEMLEAVEALGQLYLRTDRVEEAIRAFGHWLQGEEELMVSGVAIHRAERARILRLLAECHLRTGDQARARALLEESVALVPDGPSVTQLLSRLNAPAPRPS